MSDESKKKPTSKEVQKVNVNMLGAKSDEPAISITATEDSGMSATIDMPELHNSDGNDGEFGADLKEGITDSFKGLPISELIAAPFTAACEAQLKLAQASYIYMSKIGFQTDDSGKTNFETPNLLKFSLERPVETPTGIEKSIIDVQAPFLGLVPIPSLLIDSVNVSFQMEVTAASSTTDKDSKDASVAADANFRLGPFGKGNIKIEGKVSSSRETTRSTNQTAKYQVNVSASQQPQTEGLSKLMDILASCTAPLSVK